MIYFFSAREPYAKQSAKLFKNIAEQNNISGICSVLALSETIGTSNSKLTPFKVGRFLKSLEDFDLIDATENICLLAGDLRRIHGKALKLPDAIHLATCISENAILITADKTLLRIAKKLTKARSPSDL